MTIATSQLGYLHKLTVFEPIVLPFLLTFVMAEKAFIMAETAYVFNSNVSNISLFPLLLSPTPPCPLECDLNLGVLSSDHISKFSGGFAQY